MKKAFVLLLKGILTLHTFSYRATAIVSKYVEPGSTHPKHRLMRYHAFFVDRVQKGDTVVDIGCGKGELAFDVAKKAKEVVGIDMKKSSIAKAQRDYSAPNISYFVGDATKELGNKKFNVAILSNVLEHIQNRTTFLKSIKPLADIFLIRVPMINRDWITLYKKELGLEWRLDNTHETEYTLEQLQDELDQAGFILQEHSIQFGEIWAVAQKK